MGGFLPSPNQPAAATPSSLFAALTADESTVSNVLANDATLQFSGLGAGLWFITGMLLYTTAVGVALSRTWNRNGAVTFSSWLDAPNAGIAQQFTNFGITLNLPASGAIDGNHYAAWAQLFAVCNFTGANNKVFLAWASGTNGSQVTLKAGSFIQAFQP